MPPYQYGNLNIPQHQLLQTITLQPQDNIRQQGISENIEGGFLINLKIEKRKQQGELGKLRREGHLKR